MRTSRTCGASSRPIRVIPAMSSPSTGLDTNWRLDPMQQDRRWPGKPPWWPDNEPWPPRHELHENRAWRGRYFRRVALVGFLAMVLGLYGLVALTVEVSRAGMSSAPR